MTFTTRPADQPRHHREQLRGHRSCPPSFRLPGRFHSVVGYPSFRRSLVSPLLLSTVSPSAAKSFLFGGFSFSFLCFIMLCYALCAYFGEKVHHERLSAGKSALKTILLSAIPEEKQE